MHRIATVSLALTALIIGLLSVSQPANADTGNEFELWGLRASSLQVKSGACRNIAVAATTNAPYGTEDVNAWVDVWRGSKNVDSVHLSSSSSNVTTLRGTYLYCPYLDGLGKFRLGESEVDWASQGYERTGTFIDSSRGYFTVKQGARLTSFKVKKKGKTRTFSVRAQYFGADYDSSWHNFPKKSKVYLQKRASNGHGKWKVVTSAKVGKKGTAKFKVKTSKTYQYRVRTLATSRTWDGTSRTLRK